VLIVNVVHIRLLNKKCLFIYICIFVLKKIRQLYEKNYKLQKKLTKNAEM
jgi:hypothetical protein